MMRVTIKGQVTIPLEVRESMGILPAESEVEFVKDKNGRWYLKKTDPAKKKRTSRFRTAHNAAELRLSTDQILALTRAE